MSLCRIFATVSLLSFVVCASGVHASTSPTAQPNVGIIVSDKVINARFARDVNENSPINTNILDTAITGTSHIVGQVTGRLVPNEKAAAFEIVFSAHIHSNTTGEHEPVTITSTTDGTVRGVKPFYLTPKGLCATAATATADLHSQTDNIQSSLGNFKWILRRAQSQVDAKRPQADQQSDVNTAHKIEKKLNAHAVKLLVDANKSYHEYFLELFSHNGLTPESIHFSTTKNRMKGTARIAALDAHKNPGQMPEPVADADLTLIFHESMLQRAATQLLGGQAFPPGKIWNTLDHWLSLGPDDEKETNNRLTFTKTNPVEVELRDGNINLSFHYSDGEVDGKKTGPMRWVASYHIIDSSNHFSVARTNRYAASDKGNTHRRAVNAASNALATQWFNTFTGDHHPGPGQMVLPGTWSKVGPMRLVQLQAEDGWLIMSWALK